MGSAAANAPLAIEVLAVSKYVQQGRLGLILLTFTKTLLRSRVERRCWYLHGMVFAVPRLW